MYRLAEKNSYIGEFAFETFKIKIPLYYMIIPMSHWRQKMVDGAEFWIIFQQLE